MYMQDRGEILITGFKLKYYLSRGIIKFILSNRLADVLPNAIICLMDSSKKSKKNEKICTAKCDNCTLYILQISPHFVKIGLGTGRYRLIIQYVVRRSDTRRYDEMPTLNIKY